MFCLWVYFRHVRHGGGAHITGRVNGLTASSLTINHPACPQPSKNLVMGSMERLHIRYLQYVPYLTNHLPFSWINTLYLSLDANFKLKQKNHGFNDPLLGNGHSYMIADDALKKYLAECDQKQLNQEVSPIYASPLVTAHEILLTSDQHMWLHLSRCKPGTHKVFDGIFCDWCGCGGLHLPQFQMPEQGCWPSKGWMVSRPITAHAISAVSPCIS